MRIATPIRGVVCHRPVASVPAQWIGTKGAAAAAGLLCAALLAAAPGARAASPDTPYQPVAVSDPEEHGRWATRGTAAGDLDGDGVGDFFVSGGSTRYPVPNPLQLPPQFWQSVYAVSGRTRSVIYTIDQPARDLLLGGDASEGFGSWGISTLGDVSGDGISDVAVGTNLKRAHVFSGSDGDLLYTVRSPNPQGCCGLDGSVSQPASDRFGHRVGRAGDLTGDGRSELIVGAPATNVPSGCTDEPDCHREQGRAYIFNGATGALLRTLDLPASDQPAASCSDTSFCGAFGNAVQGPGDVDGDGVIDQLVDASYYDGGRGRMYLFSGRTGELLRRFDSPDPDSSGGGIFGFQDAAPLAPGDVNGDGHADIYGASFDKDGASTPNEGRAWVFDGQTGAVLYELRDPSPATAGGFGWSMAKTDYDKDGTPDLYIGQAPHHGGTGDGGTYVFSGQDGALLKALELPAEDKRPGDDNASLGYHLSAPGDLNGDGEPDFVAGAPGVDVGAEVDHGRLYVFLSRALPALSVDDVAVTEPKHGETTNATFTVSLSKASTEPVTVDFQTADDTARVLEDYILRTGTLTFAAGEQTKTVSVPVLGDTKKEPDERFLLRLSNPNDATTADAEGVGTIRDRKSDPALVPVPSLPLPLD